MKPQDIAFIIALIAIIAFCFRKPKFVVVAGLLCLLFSIPLFTFWIFFTAERLVYYAAGFFLVGIVLMLFHRRKET